ncbi:unnamed protein product [Didymodactylos carnosus]|uniref:Uncharacterized protein n=1 Tax=Didymodactylos carnosus TaxID=1234261 RepID=A0A8S2D950_9BILA|nr:unnamed protein product [Didymodactylos carnosus]CAF3618380.1 unnamed protein product [Didymodactylos carnosus]
MPVSFYKMKLVPPNLFANSKVPKMDSDAEAEDVIDKSEKQENLNIDLKRQKNLEDNHKFLESLKLPSLQKDLKNLTTFVHEKKSQKKLSRKSHGSVETQTPRRSSRIKSQPKPDYGGKDEDNSYSSSSGNDESYSSSSRSSGNEKKDRYDSSKAMMTNNDEFSWMPYAHKRKKQYQLHTVFDDNDKMNQKPREKEIVVRPKTSVKIFTPNIGARAAQVDNKNTKKSARNNGKIPKQNFLAISSSSDDE